nr:MULTISPECIES: carboxypeptidase-like regulatory domain-containing protein [unclassified Pseudonocardia]
MLAAYGTEIGDGVVVVTAGDGSQVGRAVVAPDGSYALSGLAPGTYTVVATAPGFQADAVAVTLNGSGVERDFSLQGGGTVRGVVHPVLAGEPATVLATDSAGRVVGRATTEADGTFALAGLPSGETTLTASLPGRRPRAATVRVGTGAPATVELELADALTRLGGVVTGPGGIPLGGATVTVTDDDGHVVAAVASGPGGEYEVEGLRPGSYTVTASFGGPAAQRVDLAGDGPAHLDLRLGATPAAAG